jgi:NAD(P)-dependent dehydrogenase (short-subunit alcohol dehydrogenase family)
MTAAESPSLAGHRIVVTGAGSGIGAAIAFALVKAGATVAINDLDRERAAAVAAAIGDEARTHICAGDVATPEGAQAVIAEAADAVGPLTGLVNNVGLVKGGALSSITAAEWDYVMRVDLSSALFCSQAAYSNLRETRGRIVNTTSLCGISPAPGAGSYNAAKAGVISLTQQLALEWGSDGIRVNAVAPGIISGTNFSQNSNRPEVLEQRQPIVPLGRTGTAEDIAPAAVFLLSDWARYITGQVLVVDGGLGIAIQTFVPG